MPETGQLNPTAASQPHSSAREFPRRFVASGDVLDKWETIEPYFDALRDADCATVEQLEQWLEQYSELVACIDEVGTDRHVKMTCQTDDAERKAAFLDFLENIDPKCKPRYQELDTKYAEAAAAHTLPHERYAVLDRGIKARVDIYRDQNVALQTEEAKLEQAYQEIGGAQTVTFDGKEQTMQMLSLYADNVDREVRQAAWVAEAKRRLEDVDKLEDIFDKLVALRHQMALNADCPDFREYTFKVKQRFDYTPQDCQAFHDAVERAVVPVARDIMHQRAAALNVDSLRPWDTSVDVHRRPPLRPFATSEALCTSASNVFRRVDPELGAQFDTMRDRGYLDLDSRKGKAPGGYQATYEEGRHPFIFMNAVGTQRDVRTLIHEGGHAFHCFAARNDPIVAYRSSPIEFAEVASFGMELLAIDHLGEFYANEEDLCRARRAQLEGIILLFPWVATIDAFQHDIYTNPNHSREQRKAWWLALHDRFGGIADYAGHEETLAYNWHRQLHLFEVPFYYIEYGIAKLGALQVWRNAKKDRAEAIRQYRRALSLGGSRPLPELFAAAGARFDFSYETLAPLVELVHHELEKLPQ